MGPFSGDDPKQRTATVFALVIILAIGVMTVVGALTVLRPETPVTEEADDITSLYNLVLAMALFVFFGVEALIVWVVFRYRRRDDREPDQVHGNNKLELAWTTVPIAILVFLFALSVPVVIDLRDPVDAGDVGLEVNVQGQQWFWSYEYPEQEISIVEPIDYEDPDPAALVVPVDTKVQLNIESADVVHSFYVKEFLYKIFAVPGQVNRMHFTAEETGTFTGQCAQFCGLNHAQMLIRVDVLSQEDFDAWVSEQQAAAEETPMPVEPDEGPGGAPGEPGGPDGPEPTTIVGQDIEFDVTEFSVPAGAPVTVVFDNRDEGIPHNIAFYTDDSADEVIDGAQAEVVEGPTQQELTFTAPDEAGEYYYQCDVHPDQMNGTLIVE
jgi:cytochrome c oxidase subunit II